MADSDYTPDEALVEALSKLIGSHCEYCDFYGTQSDHHSKEATRFLTTHRLVRLPEEPWGWTSPNVLTPIDGECIMDRASAGVCALSTGDGTIRPVYVIPGTPVDVAEDERP